MTALAHPIVTTADDGEDVAIDLYPTRSVAEEVAQLNPGESLTTYFAQRYNWSVLSRMASDEDLIARYSPPIRVPVYPGAYDGGFGGNGGIGSAI